MYGHAECLRITWRGMKGSNIYLMGPEVKIQVFKYLFK